MVREPFTPKFGKSRLGPVRPVRPGPRGGLTGVHCSQSGTKVPGGLTAPWGPSNWVSPISGRIRSLTWFRVVKCYFQGKSSHPINIKGRGRLRAIIQSSLSILSYFLQTLDFPTSFALVVRLHGGWGSSEWPVDLRTTLGAPFLTGSLLEHRI
jgi:hypothetical protein